MGFAALSPIPHRHRGDDEAWFLQQHVDGRVQFHTTHYCSSYDMKYFLAHQAGATNDDDVVGHCVFGHLSLLKLLTRDMKL